jgi:hypothetical protein
MTMMERGKESEAQPAAVSQTEVNSHPFILLVPIYLPSASCA